ncbi:MAG: membrane protein insertion efficiency factor YidD [Polaromonas sp.]|nr:membrane protein insertion efficiency factor YidD [Polaromonas sp.]
MKAIALFAIKAYQRYISPHKGFCCAYRAHTGYRSCSVLGYRAIRRYGVASGITVLQQRFKRCTAAHQQHLALSHSGRHRLRHSSQQGFCDVPCDCPSVDMPCDLSCDLPCDMPSGDSVQNFCDALHCCDSCDCGDWHRPRKDAEETPPPYIPPRRQGS